MTSRGIFAGCVFAAASLTSFTAAHAQDNDGSTMRIQLRERGDSSPLSPLRGGDGTLPLAPLAKADPQMPADAKVDPNPTGTNSLINPVIVYSEDTLDHVKVPVKTLKITNLHSETIYPIMRDGNEAVTKADPTRGLYDPYDAVNHEYRGYIGYKELPDGPYRFGLGPGKSILVRVPLVFWNGARMSILTESEYLTPTGTMSNPMNYEEKATKIIVKSEQDTSDNEVITNGVVMWYSGTGKKPVAPALDAPDQLVEWTIRDAKYFNNPLVAARTFNEIPNSEKVDLINYDVSYVDNMFLPAAMEALNVPVPHPPYPPGVKAQPFGWIGAVNKIDGTLLNPGLQKQIEDFTKPTNNKMLGTYFGGKGWPTYNIPMDYTKIPAGQNIFAQSPLADTRSNYVADRNAYMLSTGGALNNPVFVSVNGSGTATSGKTITLSPSEPQAKINYIKKGYKVIGNKNGVNPIAEGTVVVSTNTTNRTVVLSKPLLASEANTTFDFVRTVDDYASVAMINIWYSWAKRYLALTSATATKTIDASIGKYSAVLRFETAQNGLVEGMEVTGTGLRGPDPSKLQNGTIILSIADNKKSVTLSNVSTVDVSSPKKFTFRAPQPLPSTPAEGTFEMTFTGTEHASRNPDEFAKKVYLAMASMAQIPKNPEKTKTPHVIEFMNNVVGGNMGQIFTPETLEKEEAKMVSATIRDIIKSILRGVTDFTKYPEYEGDKRIWYPAPSEPTGKKTFNVYNLDPFVWFVHVALKFSGYGFSLDDDIADVGAGEATKFMVAVGGRPTGSEGENSGMIKAKQNANEWFIQAPYGPVTGMGDWDPTKTIPVSLNITGASYATPIVITSVEHNLSNGDQVVMSGVGGNTAANGTFTIANVTKNTFELVNSKGNGDYVAGTGKWTSDPKPYLAFQGIDVDGVYWRIKGDDKFAGFQGAFVSGPKVEDPTTRVARLGDDKLGYVVLSKPLTQTDRRGKVTPLPKGRYKFIFSGTVIKN